MWSNRPHFTSLCQKIVQPPVKPPVKPPIKPPVKPPVKTPVLLTFIPVLTQQTRSQLLIKARCQCPEKNLKNFQENEFSNDK